LIASPAAPAAYVSLVGSDARGSESCVKELALPVSGRGWNVYAAARTFGRWGQVAVPLSSDFVDGGYRKLIGCQGGMKARNLEKALLDWLTGGARKCWMEV